MMITMLSNSTRSFIYRFVSSIETNEFLFIVFVLLLQLSKAAQNVGIGTKIPTLD
jgi:hypothetical protein